MSALRQSTVCWTLEQVCGIRYEMLLDVQIKRMRMYSDSEKLLFCKRLGASRELTSDMNYVFQMQVCGMWMGRCLSITFALVASRTARSTRKYCTSCWRGTSPLSTSCRMKVKGDEGVKGDEEPSIYLSIYILFQ